MTNTYANNTNFAPGTTVSEFAPGSTTPTATLTGLSEPQGMAFDSEGNLLVANYGNYTGNGTTVSEFAPGHTTPMATLTGLNGPINLVFDSSGNLFVANYHQGSGTTVTEFAPGSTTPTITLTGLNGPTALAFDQSGDLFATNNSGTTVSEFANTVSPPGAGAGNVISGNSGDGIEITGTGTTGNVVLGNSIGTNAAGTGALANNGLAGIMIYDSNSNTIGGTAAGAGNLISGNAGNGIQLNPDNVTSPFAEDNLIEGNFIGVSASGMALANGGDGIFAFDATANTIGGTAPGAGNIVAGNNFFGVEIDYSSQNLVAGNFVGITALGALVANSDGGVSLGSASNNTIGGTAAGAGNVISGNSANGLQISGAAATGNLVAGNYIGTNQAGTAPLPNSADGVVIENGAAANTIGGTATGAGNVISGNIEAGIVVSAANNLIAGNRVGTNAAGTAALLNIGDGIDVYSNANTIGGTTGTPGTGAGNVISGNAGFGVVLENGSTGNIVLGNIVGLNATGTAAVANGYGSGVGDGIEIIGASSNTIGGTIAADRNIISGNVYRGVEIDIPATANLVEGNFIGTDLTGTVALGNGAANVFVATFGNTIGGTVAGAGNVIAGSGSYGIRLTGAAAVNLVAGNLIGTSAAGTAALPDASYGIYISGGTLNNTIGGTAPAAANVISGNSSDGININDGSGNLVEGNKIGTSAAGTAQLANIGNGITIANGSSGNTIGGTAAGARNLISGNAGDGVEITDTGTTGNVISGNFIGTNAAGTAALDSGLIVGATGGGYFGDLNLSTGQFTEIAAPSIGSEFSLTSGPGGSFYAGVYQSGDLYSISPGGVITQFGSVSAPVPTGGAQYGFWGLANAGKGIYAMTPNGNPITLDLITPDGNSLSVVGPLLTATGFGSGMMSFGPDGKLYLETLNSSGLPQLYQVNQITGAATAIGSGLGTVNNDSLTLVDTAGQLYGIDTSEATGSGPINIYTINTATGVATATGPTITGLPSGLTLDAAAAIAGDGIQIFSAGNTVGGSVAGAGNVISGNTGDGIDISGAGATGNVVAGNLIGTNAAGTAAVANYAGVEIDSGARGNLIGTNGDGMNDALERNIISGNSFAGVWMTGTGTDDNVVAGNYIGTTVTGDTALGNGSKGVYYPVGPAYGSVIGGGVVIADGASDNLIGTSGQSADDAGERNVIAGSPVNDGVDISGSGTAGNVVAGNFIGTNAAGTAALGNAGDGVYMETLTAANWIGVNPVYGPENADEGNVISGNGFGLQIGDSTSQVVAGNLIGTNAAGLAAIPNGCGVQISDSTQILIGISGQDGPADALERNLISGNSGAGVWITYISNGSPPVSTANVVAGNYIGTNASGTAALGNGADGVLIDGGASANTIGGTIAADRNIISGNYTHGVEIDSPATGNLVEGNYIGTDSTGTAALGNGASGGTAGVYITGGGNTIGGTVAGAGNVIAGSGSYGIRLTTSTASGNLVAGDFIGTNAAGTSALPNAIYGIYISGGVNNTIGGTVAPAANIISGNLSDGININDGSGNLVEGNQIGTTAAGTAALANHGNGVTIDSGSTDNTIGGVTAGDRNVISGNTGAGVQITGAGTAGNVIAGNLIGTNVAGTAAVANGADGVDLVGGATANTVGGITPAARNVISGNEGQGVWVSDSGTANNIVAGNFIGTDITGTVAIGNSSAGIYVNNVPGTTIGGTVVGAGNVISANVAFDEIFVTGTGATGTLVAGNLIGTNAAGTAALGTTLRGVTFSNAGGSTIGGLTAAARNVISGLQSEAVLLNLSGTTGMVVEGNFIGTDITGTLKIGNGTDGVLIASGATANTIGGAAAGARNVISGNTGDGVEISGAGTTGNTVAGNFLGTDFTGTLAIPNYAGVEIDSGATSNSIGTNGDGVNDALERNIASGNLFAGVWLTGTGTDNNVVAGNYIGTDVSGTVAVGNGSVIQNFPNYYVSGGVEIANGASDNLIGTSGQSADDAGQRNVISGNGPFVADGVDIYGSGTTGNVVAGNFLGTNATGTAALGNGLDDVFVGNTSSVNWIGVNSVYGPKNADQANVLSASPNFGIEIFDTTGVVVAGNLIGTNAAGSAAIPNIGGVALEDSSNVLIGTTGQNQVTSALERNVISGNSGEGVDVATLSGYTGVPAVSTDDVVAGNYIGTNAAGTAALPNAGDGIDITSGAYGNSIGVNAVYGPENADQRNVISGNTKDGVEITGTGTTGDTVAGNFIGTDFTGTQAIPNYAGVEIDSGASGNSIGTNGDGVNDALERNIASGNLFAGVWLTGTGTDNNVVAGNYIGTDFTGTIALGNSSMDVLSGVYYINGGVVIDGGASDNLIGTSGHGADERNVISGNDYTAVIISDSGTSGNVVAGNYLGTTVSGEAALGDGIYGDGVDIVNGASGNWIGVNSAAGPGTESADQGNLISGNNITDNDVGVWIGPNTAGNVIAGNLIGTDSTGTESLPNYVGIEIQGSANLVGTTGQDGADDAIERNLISGNTQEGVLITGTGATDNVVAGNTIGTNAAGAAALANSTGVLLEGGTTGNTIGGTAGSTGNLISGNSGDGVEITGSGTTDNVIAGNLIGTDPTGRVALGNVGPGVLIFGGSAGNTIGGTTTGAGNLISGGMSAGVSISGTGTSGNILLGNQIGTDVSGTSALANASGVVIAGGASDNSIGGTAAAAGNVIAFNASIGVTVGAGATDPSTGNVILYDSIHDNAGGGVDNDSSGVLIISDSTISGNSTSGSGGGVVNESSGTVTITSSTIANNSASSSGGGIENFGSLTLTNSTVADNEASGASGGGIDSAGTLVAVNSTIAYNTSPSGSGGGLYDETNGLATLDNTIVAQNTGVDGPDDIAGAAVSSTSMYNLVGVDETDSITNRTDGNQVGVADLALGTLANNGGPTQTIALMADSPAIDAGNNALIPAGLTTDQRGVGFARIVDGTVDIGAYESPYLSTVTSVSSSVNASAYGQSVTFTATISDTSGLVPAGSVEFYDGPTDLGAGSILSGGGQTATSTFSISTLGAGSHSIMAVFTGIGVFENSAAPSVKQ